MGVSKNRGTPKSSILIGFSIINHPFWGTPIFGNIQILLSTYKKTTQNFQVLCLGHLILNHTRMTQFAGCKKQVLNMTVPSQVPASSMHHISPLYIILLNISQNAQGNYEPFLHERYIKGICKPGTCKVQVS